MIDGLDTIPMRLNEEGVYVMDIINYQKMKDKKDKEKTRPVFFDSDTILREERVKQEERKYQ